MRILWLGLLLSSPVLACECAGWEGVRGRDLLRQADAVFVGTPVAKSRVVGTAEYDQQIVQTTFRVLQGFKPSSARRIHVRSLKGDGANCGVDFQGNEGHLLVVAYRERGHLRTTACDLSDLADQDAETTRLLRELRRASR